MTHQDSGVCVEIPQTGLSRPARAHRLAEAAPQAAWARAWAAQQSGPGFAEPVSRTLHRANTSLVQLSAVCARENSGVPTLPLSPGQPHIRALILSTVP